MRAFNPIRVGLWAAVVSGVGLWATAGHAAAQSCSTCGPRLGNSYRSASNCNFFGLRLNPRFESRYIRQFCQPTICPSSCFGHFRTQWTRWPQACPNWQDADTVGTDYTPPSPPQPATTPLQEPRSLDQSTPPAAKPKTDAPAAPATPPTVPDITPPAKPLGAPQAPAPAAPPAIKIPDTVPPPKVLKQQLNLPVAPNPVGGGVTQVTPAANSSDNKLPLVLPPVPETPATEPVKVPVAPTKF
ncbi:hypothetical protein [Fimbriiglobus ruber]|uniref:Fe-S oxidoreductase n=1 Tax=Fimbriiglobus ruber TaxID=1908690 RepID=A0A225E1U1_9BACT|nr:hypothetical protein [Fimbriiglobus ruber]OWK47521.1 Fe-S oxidoreductase [Fimbriiglobus ruber]